jgi:hypothetical protein
MRRNQYHSECMYVSGLGIKTHKTLSFIWLMHAGTFPESSLSLTLLHRSLKECIDVSICAQSCMVARDDGDTYSSSSVLRPQIESGRGPVSLLLARLLIRSGSDGEHPVSAEESSRTYVVVCECVAAQACIHGCGGKRDRESE